MDDSWKRAYRGDKGVPHTDPQQLINTWTGSFMLASISWLHTQTAKLTKIFQVNWNDTAMKLDQQNWKKFFDKKKLKQKTLRDTNGSS